MYGLNPIAENKQGIPATTTATTSQLQTKNVSQSVDMTTDEARNVFGGESNLNTQSHQVGFPTFGDRMRIQKDGQRTPAPQTQENERSKSFGSQGQNILSEQRNTFILPSTSLTGNSVFPSVASTSKFNFNTTVSPPSNLLQNPFRSLLKPQEHTRTVTNSTVVTKPATVTSSQSSAVSAFEQRFGPGASSGNIFGASAKLAPNSSTTSLHGDRLLQVHPHERLAKSDERRQISHGKSVKSTVSVMKKEKNYSDRTRHIGSKDGDRNQLFARAVASVSTYEDKSKLAMSEDIKRKEPRPRKLSEKSAGDNDVFLKLTQEEIERLTSVVVKGVPQKHNNKQFMLEHFGKFGIINRITCMAQKEMAVVYFTDHASAQKAKSYGAELEPGMKPVQILFGRISTSPNQSNTPVARSLQSRKPPRRRSKNKSSDDSVAKAKLQVSSERDDVQAEILSMAQSDTMDNPKILDRPKDFVTQSSLVKASKSLSAATQIDSGQSDNSVDILKKQALTSADKFQILAARDKLLRQKFKKPSDFASAKALVGTCMDMCPEKERYMREMRSQLYSYEITATPEKSSESIVDHRMAIKEYNRPSADQEEPLPHELRPPQVLLRTMDYLVCNVMDLLDTSEGSAVEWYDFVWNRTRAIRKDITQQHLCDEISVSLIEKCARFHIHCAERLCEEDMSSFDQKINNENLTKCLQTLKHFYCDLQAKGICCVNESEFRAYHVLLNLNEGDTLREVQCLLPGVRQSAAVEFALKVFAAINSNNYVAFFKNVKNTTYLNGCVLQRYFNQVRERALKVILKSYCPPNHSGLFPLSKFIEMLAFDDINEAQEFLEYHHLSLESGFVVLDRTNFVDPETAFPLKRARNLIERKIKYSIGEVINGEPLPQNPLHYYVPHSSFDKDGFLISEMPISNRERDVHVEQNVTESGQIVVANDVTSSVNADNFDERRKSIENKFYMIIERALLSIIDDMLQSIMDSICGHVILKCRAYRVLDAEIIAALVEDVCSSMCRGELGSNQLPGHDTARSLQLVEVLPLSYVRLTCSHKLSFQLQSIIMSWQLIGLRFPVQLTISSYTDRHVAAETLMEAKKEELLSRTQKENEMLEYRRHVLSVTKEYTVQKADSILSEIVNGETRRVALQVLSKERDKERRNSLLRCTESLSTDYMLAWISSFAGEISADVLKETSLYRRTVLDRICKKLNDWRAIAFVGRWRYQVARRKRLRHSMENFPSSSLGSYSKRMAERWVGSKSHFLPSPLQIVGDQQYINSLLNINVKCNHLKQCLENVPLDVCAIMKKVAFGDKVSTSNFHPELKNDIYWKVAVGMPSNRNGFYSWLKTKLGDGSDSKDVTSSSNVELWSLKKSIVGHRVVGVCVKAFYDDGNIRSSGDYLEHQDLWGTGGLLMILDLFQNDEALFNWTEGYNRLEKLLQSKPCWPPLPVLILTSEKIKFNDIVENLRLDELIHCGLIGEFQVLQMNDEVNEPFSTIQLLKGMEWLASHCLQPPTLLVESLHTFMDTCITRHFSFVIAGSVCKRKEGCVQEHPLPDLVIALYNDVLDQAAAVVTSSKLQNVSWPPVEFCSGDVDLLEANWNSPANLTRLLKLINTYKLPSFPQTIVGDLSLQYLTEAVWNYVDVVNACLEHCNDYRPKIILASRIQKFLEAVQGIYSMHSDISNLVPWSDLIHSFVMYLLQILQGETINVVYNPQELANFQILKDWMAFKSSYTAPVIHLPAKPNVRPEHRENSLKRKLRDPFAPHSKEKELRQDYRELSRQLRIEKNRNAEYDEYLKTIMESDF